MTFRRSLWIVCLVATLNGLFFIWYQRPDWSTQWTDQDGYRRLGQVLAATGKFTRFPDAPVFVPEVLRTPLYPLFVALLYKLFGVHHIFVAVLLAHAGLRILAAGAVGIPLSALARCRLRLVTRLAVLLAAGASLFFAFTLGLAL